MQVTLQIANYISHPYWPARDDVINVRKLSACDAPKLGQAKREQRLEEYLKKQGMTKAGWEALNETANREWHRNEKSEIIIHKDQVMGMIVCARCLYPVKWPKITPANIRNFLSASDFQTGKTGPDGVYQRYVRSDASNQRRLQRNEYIADFHAVGEIEFFDIKQDDLVALLQWAGKYCGIGAARKMGYGKFTVVEPTL